MPSFTMPFCLWVQMIWAKKLTYTLKCGQSNQNGKCMWESTTRKLLSRETLVSDFPYYSLYLQNRIRVVGVRQFASCCRNNQNNLLSFGSIMQELTRSTATSSWDRDKNTQQWMGQAVIEDGPRSPPKSAQKGTARNKWRWLVKISLLEIPCMMISRSQFHVQSTPSWVCRHVWGSGHNFMLVASNSWREEGDGCIDRIWNICESNLVTIRQYHYGETF